MNVNSINSGYSGCHVASFAIFLPVNELQKLLIAAAKRYPMQKDFAEAIGLRPEYVSRLLSDRAAPNVSIAVESCLRLAAITGKSPQTVLRAADKGDVADLLIRLFGPDRVAEADAMLASLGDPGIIETARQLAAVPEVARRPIADLIASLAAETLGQDRAPSPESLPDATPAVGATLGRGQRRRRT